MSGRREDVLHKSGTFLNQTKRTLDGNSTRIEKMSIFQNEAFSKPKQLKMLTFGSIQGGSKKFLKIQTFIQIISPRLGRASGRCIKQVCNIFEASKTHTGREFYSD